MSVKVSSRVYGTPSGHLEIPGEPFHGPPGPRWGSLVCTNLFDDTSINGNRDNIVFKKSEISPKSSP